MPKIEIRQMNIKKNRTKPQGPSKVAICIAETVGTAILLFLGCMGCIHVGGPFIHQFPALTFGFAVMLVIQIFGHISGGHLNPAVTIGAVYLGVVDIMTAPFYIIGQFVGATVGFGMLKLLIPSDFTATTEFNAETNETIYKAGLCTNTLGNNMEIMPAVCLEMILTAILVLVCAGVWDKRNADKHDSVAIRFGLVIACLATAGGPFSGASMNTARSFGPALINWYWDGHWIYWVGPNVGAVLGAAFYKFLFKAPEDNEIEGEEMAELAVQNNLTNKV